MDNLKMPSDNGLEGMFATSVGDVIPMKFVLDRCDKAIFKRQNFVSKCCKIDNGTMICELDQK